MTRPLEDLLSRVQAVQPNAAEWSGIQTKITATLASAEAAASVSAAASANMVSVKSALSSGASAHSTIGGSWLAGSVATGAIAVGLAFGYQKSGSSMGGDAFEPAALVEQRTGYTTADAVPYGFIEPQSEAWVPSPRRVSRRTSHEKLASTRAEPASKADLETAVVPLVNEPLGESDVEYDRRHLAAIDDALRVQEPRRALKLLAEFKPKKLHVYARSLRAIALCEVGALAAGAELSRMLLPEITNGGLERRVRNACGLE